MSDNRSRDERDLIHLINYVHRAYRKAANRALAAQGLSDSQALPVLFIARLGDGVRPGTLAEQLGVEGPSLVRQLDQLVTAGLVARREDPEDRRAKTLHLTELGRTMAWTIEAMFRDVRARYLSSIPDQDLAAALRTLKSFEAALASGG